MAVKQYLFTTPENYDYDSAKVEVSGGVARLKEDLTNVYARYHLNEATGEICLDTSGNGRNGTPINSPVSVVGKLNNCLSFNGINQYINCGNIAQWEHTQLFSVGIWIKYSSIYVRGIVGNISIAGIGRGWQIYTSGETLGFQLRGGTSTNSIHTTIIIDIDDDFWHYLVFTYDGSSLASGVNCYVDGALQSLTVLNDNLTSSIISDEPLTIGRANEKYMVGSLDEVVIYGKELILTEVVYNYNLGNGRENVQYYSDKPTIEPIESWIISGLNQFIAFVETLGTGNEGNLAYQLSDDDGVSWRYWNGSNWVIATIEYNDASTVHTNIDQFPIVSEKIKFKAFLISNGNQKVELDTTEITALAGSPPTVYAGADKQVKDGSIVKVFSDATIEDPDGNIESATAWYNIEASGWTQISKGSYGTLQEAIRNFQYTFNNIGIINCQLKVIDETARETIDDLDVTVSKYVVTFNIKDSKGNHLAGVYFKAGDGSGYVEKQSPFTYEYEYNVSGYDIVVDKSGYGIHTAMVPSTDHTENFTLLALIDTSTFADDIKRLLGLNQENFRILSPVYDAESNLTSATIRIYPTAEDCENNTNPISEYTIYATYSGNQLLSYKVKRA